ncbi:unnamed protein product [Aureobasidium mustum]|uniref:F-box domain-containing protein n=1 Tax=Aureobasidium mustum TaxID=2773714 RepID=A0A9N8PJ66_9PEZI|nr:unnamed protein product [Aureobasidium mustum]
MASKLRVKGKGKQTSTRRAVEIQSNKRSIEQMSNGALPVQTLKRLVLLSPSLQVEALPRLSLPFLLLPPEVRLMIYNYVFDTDTVVTGPINKKTFTRIYTIDQPQSQHDLALLRTCRILHADVKKLVNPRSIVRNISAAAIVKYTYGACPEDDHRTREPELLRKIIKLSVRIDIQRKGNPKRYGTMDPNADSPLILTFLDEGGRQG